MFKLSSQLDSLICLNLLLFFPLSDVIVYILDEVLSFGNLGFSGFCFFNSPISS